MFDTLVIATHNPGKLKEFRHLLATLPLRLTSAGELNLPAPEETGTTFVENALIKARAAAKASNLPTLADDSGVSIAALGGQPGVYTADWVKAGSVQKLPEILAATDDHSATVTCVLALALPDGTEQLFEGCVKGTMVWPPRGQSGFGYDPCFQPDGETRTYAEMNTEEKSTLSHRTRAFEKLLAALRQHA